MYYLTVSVGQKARFSAYMYYAQFHKAEVMVSVWYIHVWGLD